MFCQIPITFSDKQERSKQSEKRTHFRPIFQHEPIEDIEQDTNRH